MLLSVLRKEGVDLMDIKIDRNIGTPFYWQIANQLKEKIISGEIADGAFLPSERYMAKLIGVHRNTIIKSYSTLKDQELIDSKQGAGYYVTYNAVTEIEPDIRMKVNWSHIIKDKYQDMERTFDDIYQRYAESTTISLATGMVPAIYDEQNIAETLAEILSNEGRKPSFLSPYQGDVVLRQQIVYFLREKGIKVESSEIQLVTETNQALDYLVTTLLNEGDRVIIEEPVSPDVYRVIQLAGCIPVTVPVDENGMICDNLEALIETNKPKFIYINSSYQDPTGYVLSLERRKKILELSNKYKLPIIEEDAASELSFENNHLPPIKSMDKNGNVIYIYSFSLTFIPGISLACIVAPSRLTKILGYLVSIKMVTLDWMTQKLLARYMMDGKYELGIKEIVETIKVKCDLMCSYLDKVRDIGVEYIKPKGGVYLWCKLPDGVDGKTVASEAMKRGIFIIPGEVFYPYRNGGQNYIRINYSYESTERISLGMTNILEIITKLVP